MNLFGDVRGIKIPSESSAFASSGRANRAKATDSKNYLPESINQYEYD